ncbi:MAG: SPOR domain-containing protein [Porphyrobacter sp.]|nr:SPOR domain-containing protein [Porphyrobacter sp.]
MTMDRSTKTGLNVSPRLALAVTTAIAGMAMAGAGAVATAAPRAGVSFENAQEALAKGKVEKAIRFGEDAVLADPRNPAYRALLGAAYLEAGRFESAATSFGDALDLGDTNPRTVLSFALAKIALGDKEAALDALDGNADNIDAADLGLALALAGQPERGVHVLVNAVRSAEQATPKLRQNLAYTYALAGNWRAARVMAAEDVPADKLEARMAQWAAHSAPEMFRQRIASLLDVSPRADSGQPQPLALANFPAQSAVMVAAAAPEAELADAEPVQVADNAPSPSFTAAFAASEPTVATVQTEAPGNRYVSNPVVQQLPSRPAVRTAAAAPAAPRVAAASQRRMAATSAAVAAPADKSPATHLVQLGAYSSKIEAERGWTVLKTKFPQLKGKEPVITEAVVNGRTFWRVAAEGFGANSAKAMCGTVKSAGRGCFAYAATTPPAGAVKRNVQVASRSR